MLRTRYHVFRAEIRRNCTVGIVLHPYRAKLETDRSLGRMCYGRTAAAISRIGYDRCRGVVEFWTLHVWPENVTGIVKASRPRWESAGLLAIRSEAGRKRTEIIKTFAAGTWSAFDLRVPSTLACVLSRETQIERPVYAKVEPVLSGEYALWTRVPWQPSADLSHSLTRSVHAARFSRINRFYRGTRETRRQTTLPLAGKLYLPSCNRLFMETLNNTNNIRNETKLWVSATNKCYFALETSFASKKLCIRSTVSAGGRSR